MSYYAKRERTINGFKVTTIFEEFEEQVGEICIDFETTSADGTPVSNTDQTAGFSVKDIRSIFKGIKVMMTVANNKGCTTFSFTATNDKRYSVYKRFIKVVGGEITEDDGEHVTFEAIV